MALTTRLLTDRSEIRRAMDRFCHIIATGTISSCSSSLGSSPSRRSSVIAAYYLVRRMGTTIEGVLVRFSSAGLLTGQASSRPVCGLRASARPFFGSLEGVDSPAAEEVWRRSSGPVCGSAQAGLHNKPRTTADKTCIHVRAQADGGSRVNLRAVPRKQRAGSGRRKARASARQGWNSCLESTTLPGTAPQGIWAHLPCPSERVHEFATPHLFRQAGQAPAPG